MPVLFQIVEVRWQNDLGGQVVAGTDALAKKTLEAEILKEAQTRSKNLLLRSNWPGPGDSKSSLAQALGVARSNLIEAHGGSRKTLQVFTLPGGKRFASD